MEVMHLSVSLSVQSFHWRISDQGGETTRVVVIGYSLDLLPCSA